MRIQNKRVIELNDCSVQNFLLFTGSWFYISQVMKCPRHIFSKVVWKLNDSLVFVLPQVAAEALRLCFQVSSPSGFRWLISTTVREERQSDRCHHWWIKNQSQLSEMDLFIKALQPGSRLTHQRPLTICFQIAAPTSLARAEQQQSEQGHGRVYGISSNRTTFWRSKFGSSAQKSGESRGWNVPEDSLEIQQHHGASWTQLNNNNGVYLLRRS